MKKTGLNNIRIKKNNSFYGTASKNGKQIKAQSKDKIICAQKLNTRCREAGFSPEEIPNPEVGFYDPPKNLTDLDYIKKIQNSFYGSIYKLYGKRIQAKSKDKIICAQKLNTKCREAGFLPEEIPNPEVGFFDFLKNSTGLNNIQKRNNSFNGYIYKNGNQIRATDKDKIICAQKLNTRCREAGFSPEEIPNPEVGFYQVSKKRKFKSNQIAKRKKRKV